MDLGLEGRTALVSGASGGLGRAIAARMAAFGADAVLLGRSEERLRSSQAEIERAGRQAAISVGDLRQPEVAEKAVRLALERFGKLDLVVHAAGATKRGDFLNLSDADFDDGFSLKFMGCVRLTRAAWPHLVSSRGAIVNVIGMGGVQAEPDFTIGGSVNAALMNFVKAMAARGLRDGVRVMGVNPGIIETDRTRRRLAVLAEARGIPLDVARRELLHEHELPRFGEPNEIANLVCFMAGATGSFMQGSIVNMDGGEYHGL